MLEILLLFAIIVCFTIGLWPLGIALMALYFFI